MKTVFIVIVHFNNSKDTYECLNSLRQIKSKKIQISCIVVDNGSKEKFRDDEVIIITNKQNLGFSGGNNVGISYALDHNADYILLLNNDTLVDENLVDELVSCIDSDPAIGIAVPKIYFAKGYEFHKERYKNNELGKVIWYAGGGVDWKNVIGFHRGVDEVDHGQYERREITEFATGCCMLVKREVIKKIGMLDERYFLYYEDSDFSQRVIKAGYKIMYTPKAFLWHKNAGSAGGSGSALQDYYISRNRMLFGMRWAPFRSKISLVKESIAILFSGRAWQKKGIIDYYRMKLGQGTFNI